MKPVIGILEALKINDEKKPYDNYYKLTNLYVDRIIEEGGVPLGIINVDDEILNRCDGFLLPGGNRITKDHYKIIDYSIKNNKPLLGICAGMQALVMYDYLYNECLKENNNPNYEDLYQKYLELEKNKVVILQKIENHGSDLSSGNVESTLENINKSIHKINVNKNSILYEIYNMDSIDVVSMHGYGVYGTTGLFTPIAYSLDNLVEAIQYKDKFILGLQFHIELEKNNPVIKRLIKECSNNLTKK